MGEFTEQQKKIGKYMKKYRRSKRKPVEDVDAKGNPLSKVPGVKPVVKMQSTMNRASEFFGKPMSKELEAMKKTASRYRSRMR